MRSRPSDPALSQRAEARQVVHQISSPSVLLSSCCCNGLPLRSPFPYIQDQLPAHGRANEMAGLLRLPSVLPQPCCLSLHFQYKIHSYFPGSHSYYIPIMMFKFFNHIIRLKPFRITYHIYLSVQSLRLIIIYFFIIIYLFYHYLLVLFLSYSILSPLSVNILSYTSIIFVSLDIILPRPPVAITFISLRPLSFLTSLIMYSV